MIDIPESSWASSDRSSVCRYTPRTKLDYGQLLCWAENDLAMQTKPCVFSIVPAGQTRLTTREGMGLWFCVTCLL